MQLNEIKQKLKEKPNQWAIQAARNQQSKIRFHTDIILNRTEAGVAYFEFINWVGSLLKQDKFNRFNQLLRFPNPNNELTDAIYSELHKALNSEDYVETYVFSDDNSAADWDAYKAKFNKFWHITAWDTYRRSINSFIIIDWPELQVTDKPEAGYFFLDVDNVLDAEVDADNKCHYILFKTARGTAAYCDEYLRLFNDNDELIAEVEHGLGETPARNFWTDTLNVKSNLNKKAAISGELSELDWLLMHRVNKKYLDIGNSYPIIYEYEADDDDTETDSDDKPTAIKGDTKNAGNELVGAGSYKTVPAPSDKDEPDLMNKPIHTEKVDKDALEFATNEQKRLEFGIFTASVGIGGEAANDSAKNEKQVQSGFESRENILKNIAYNFAVAKSWANGMVCKIRYGDMYLSNFIYGGSKFFLRSEAEIIQSLGQYDSDVIRESLNDQLIENRFKKDDTQRMRAEMILELDPYAYRSNTEIISLFEKSLISWEDFQIKQKLFTFVKKFERENGTITSFELSKPYDKRIELIKNTIKSYVESQQRPEPRD
jgi:hypothetical protein